MLIWTKSNRVSVCDLSLVSVLVSFNTYSIHFGKGKDRKVTRMRYVEICTRNSHSQHIRVGTDLREPSVEIGCDFIQCLRMRRGDSNGKHGRQMDDKVSESCIRKILDPLFRLIMLRI